MFFRAEVILYVEVLLVSVGCVLTLYCSVPPIVIEKINKGHVIDSYRYVFSSKHYETPVYFITVSEAASYPPASCIFSFIMGICAFVSAFGVFIRYRQLDVFCYSKEVRNVMQVRINVAGLVIGMSSTAGLHIVAAFQQKLEWEIHMVGAFMVFICMNLYFFIQTVLSYQLKNVPGHNKYMPFFRLGLWLIHLFASSVMTASRLIYSSDKAFIRTLTTVHFRIPVHKHDCLLWFTTMEWTSLIVYCVYMTSFIGEFKYFCYTLPEIKFIRD